MTNNNDLHSDNLKEQAAKAGTTPEHLKQQLDHGKKPELTKPDASLKPEEQLQDGYTTSEGSNYGQPAQDEQEQEGYDPSHSGVRHSHNKPGTRTNAPGREGASGWAEQLQMGQSADAPVRKNPAD